MTEFIKYEPNTNIMEVDDESSDEEMDSESTAMAYGQLILLADTDTMVGPEILHEEAMEEINEEKIKPIKTEPNEKYKKYDEESIKRFIDMVGEEGPGVAKAAEICNIPRSTAYELLDQWNASSRTIYPKGCKKKKSVKNDDTLPGNTKLSEVHTNYVIELVDKNPCIAVNHIREELYLKFKNLTISVAALHAHMKNKCFLSLKNAQIYTRDRDAERTLNLRFDFITQWKEAGVDFMKNCVFMDEAGFNSHQIRRRAWAPKGQPALVKVPTQKGMNISIVGCISPFGTINFSKVEPLKPSDAAKIEKQFPQPASKKRKATTTEEPKPKLKKGTTAYHIITFVNTVMDTLDKHNKKGFYIVMDNCRIHHSHFVVEAITQRGYKPLFMPPYSPFLNPIEECWSKIKKNIRRNPLSKLDQLTPRIAEACATVTVNDCVNWIKHSETFWDRCLNRETSLC